MRVALWGTRGSLATPGPDTVRYGGNTSCVEVRSGDTQLVLDAGTGIRRLDAEVAIEHARVDILLTHLHMDHIQGLGFFSALFRPDAEVHIWGPASTTHDLSERLARYLSPPLFPVRLRDLPDLTVHDVPLGPFEIGALRITAALVCHPGPTVGYRISENGVSMAYVPDHEPALGCRHFPDDAEWMSGYDLVAGVDLLLHDAQYDDAEYAERVGWGHSSIFHARDFAVAAGVTRLVTFHHDPSHHDRAIDLLVEEARRSCDVALELVPGAEGTAFVL
jgi:phosphoribosyl 1,2-cyclic phosphodiesterase